MTDLSGAVFLSYASQDAEAAQRICEALRAGGIEVFLDQSELRGGDAWDQKIRRQIKNCALFIPLISKHTHERPEGYFRLEWKLAVDRSHLIMASKAFLVPVVIDDTRDDDENVPDKFHEVQWTRLPGGKTPPAFVERVRGLLAGAAATTVRAPAVPLLADPPAQVSWSRRALAAGAALVIAGTAAYLGIERPWISKLAAFAPPAHSIAVLPFVNLSGDKGQEYFSDGLTEEVLNSIAEINDLQVAARTSSFYFKDQRVDLDTVAHKLNVAAVLEGSVRRSEHTMRVTVQLINSVTGFHLWSKSYDRDVGDVLKLQTEIATAVADALRVTLLGDLSGRIELGGTRNAAAFDAYLRGEEASRSRQDDAKDIPRVIDMYSEAVRLDPNFALAFVGRSYAYAGYAVAVATGAEIRASFEKAESDARRALALAPQLPQAHLALASVFEDATLDFTQAHVEYERALALASGNAEVLRFAGAFDATMGRFDAGITAARRAVVLDPLARNSHLVLGGALYSARRYREATSAFEQAIRLSPGYAEPYADRGLALYGLAEFDAARASCEMKHDELYSPQCLAVVYDKLGRHTDAQRELARIKARLGNAGAYQYASIYAQWGDHAQALEWLDTAMRLRDPSLESLKTDPLMDPLRQEPRFQAVMRELNFPELKDGRN